MCIPILLPYTKQYGLYGAGFKYSISGNQFTNPILSDSLGGFDPILLQLLSYNYATKINYPCSTQHVFEITYTDSFNVSHSTKHSIGLYWSNSSQFSGTISTPCIVSSEVAPFIITSINSDANAVGVKLDVFGMLRNSLSLTQIKMSIIKYNFSSENISKSIYWGSYRPGIVQPPIYYGGVFDSVGAELICPTTLTNYNTITLDKSTGFVLTVT